MFFSLRTREAATRRSQLLLSISWLVCIGLAESILACPYSIRDSAFIGRGSATPYELVLQLPAEIGAREAIAKSLERAAARWLTDSNITTSIEAREDPPTRAAEDNWRGGRAILRHPDGRELTLVHLKGLPSAEELDAICERAVSSELRRQLPSWLVENWCVVLWFPGSDAEQGRAQLRRLEESARAIVCTRTELGKVVGKPPRIVPVDVVRERVVAWSLGVAAREEQSARAIVLAGRGETRGPHLDEKSLHRESIDEHFTMLGRSCSCTTSATWLIGAAIPMTWSVASRAAAEASLGFDPLDPAVLRSVRGERETVDPLVGLDGFDLGYDEIDLETPPAAVAVVAETAEPRGEIPWKDDARTSVTSSAPVDVPSIDDSAASEVSGADLFQRLTVLRVVTALSLLVMVAAAIRSFLALRPRDPNTD